MKVKRPKFVEVEWHDAISTSEWTDRANMPHVTVCISRGWVMANDKRKITLAATLQVENGDQVGEVLSIPRGMVKKIRQLKWT